MSSLSLLELEPPEDVPFAEPVEMPAWMLEAPRYDGPEPCTCACCYEPPDVPEPVQWAVPGVTGLEPAAPLPVEPGLTVQRLASLVGSLADVDPTSLPAGQARAEADLLHQVEQKLRVLLLDRDHDVMARQLYDLDGHRSVAAWQRAVAPDAVDGDRTLARRLQDLPFLSAALRDGRVCVSAASRVAAEMVKVRPHLDRPDGLIDGQPAEPVVAACVGNVVTLVCEDRFGLDETDPARSEVLERLQRRADAISAAGGSQRERVEQAFVLLAEHLPAARLRQALEQLVLAILPSRGEEQEKAAHDKRSLTLKNNADGTVEVQATLTPECAERLETALGAEARRDPENPSDTLAWTLEHPDGYDPDAERDPETQVTQRPEGSLRRPRSRTQRLHDALNLLLDRYLSQGLGGEHDKVPVQVAVTVPEPLITGAPGALPAKSSNGRLLARSLVKRWWCDAHVTVLLLSKGRIPLGIVHSGRTLTGKERLASQVQFGNRCAGEGCCRGRPGPLTPLVPHHVIKHAVTGKTSMSETLWVCPTLHQDIHHGRLVRLRDGRLVTENGWVEES